MRKNPLHKRLLREMKTELGKYIVIFILLVTTIGFVSGFLVADNSMLLAYNDGFQKYNIEDGHFVTEKKMNRAQLKCFMPKSRWTMAVPCGSIRREIKSMVCA